MGQSDVSYRAGILSGLRRGVSTGLVGVLLLCAGCSTLPPGGPAATGAPAAGRDVPYTFEVPRRSTPLTPAQEDVRQQATSAVEADIDGYLARYLESTTTRRDAAGRLQAPGTCDIVAAMHRGPLLISADEMRDLFPQYAESAATRSQHAVSVHEAVTAMAAELYRRALLVRDPRDINIVLFTAGGVASGKTTAIESLADARDANQHAQIIYDGTMGSLERSREKIRKAMDAGKLVGVVYVYTPIERSVVWLVERAVETGRVVPAEATADSHWHAQQTFLSLVDEFAGDASVSFLLIDNSGERAQRVPPQTMHDWLYADDSRFVDEDAFTRYTKTLIREQLQRMNASGRLLPETEQAFDADE